MSTYADKLAAAEARYFRRLQAATTIAQVDAARMDLADDKARLERQHCCPLCGEYLPHRNAEDCAGHPIKQLRK